MYPWITFTLSGSKYTIASYTLFAFIGALTGIFLSLPLLKREGISVHRSIRLLTVMLLFFLAGARILNFIINPKAYGTNLHLYSLKFAGFSVYGGIFGALAALLIWCKIERTDPQPVLDALVIPSGLAFVFARIGCFLNGCCYGKPTTSFLGVVFPQKQATTDLLSKFVLIFGKAEIAVYPTQLFEASLALIGLIPIIRIYLFRKKRIQKGVCFLLYAVWFSAMRLAVLPLRSFPYEAVITHVFYPALYLTVIAAGSLLLWKKTRSVI